MSYRRSIKILGLAVVAAIAAMAFAGAGSASANATLCKVNANPCTALWPASATEHSTIVATSEEAVLTGTLSEKCKSETEILVEGSDATALLGKVIKLVWTNCTGACSGGAETKQLPAGTGSLTPTGSGNGTLKLGETKVELKNCFGVNCLATATAPTLTFNGGAIGTANATADNIAVGLPGGLCGTSGTWNAGGTHGGKPYVVKSVNGVTTGTGIFTEAS
jgi:hypothetical protein